VILAGLVIVVIGGAAFVMLRKGGEGPTMPPTSTPPPSVSGGTTVYAPGTQVMERGTTQYYAGLELPSGQVIPVTSMSQDFGRSDFESFVPKEVSSIISRRHFQISFSPRDKKFYIEDAGSTNGTMVNGTDVKGKGKFPLNPGDVISPADVVNLKFKG
jgi:FHA domain